METEIYQKIRSAIRKETIKILHCHGIPGCGKTHIASSLAESFPYENASGSRVIRWYIQCQDRNDNVKEKLKKLADELLGDSLITCEKNANIKADFDNDIKDPAIGTEKLVQALFECDVNVIILIEDLEENDRKLLHDMCVHLQRASSRTGEGKQRRNKFHMYITSRKAESLFSDQENKSHYQLEKISGFTEQEALSFLKGMGNHLAFDKKAAKKLCERFSCLPHGLKCAREYCITECSNYKEYLDLLRHYEVLLEKKEREFILKKFGPSAQHVFEAIVMPFQVNDDSDYDRILPWRILSCLSYFHPSYMPKLFLERCCIIVSSDDSIDKVFLKKEKKFVGKLCVNKLINKLKNYGLGIETTKPMHNVIFHQVVLNAFRVHHQALGPRSISFSLKKAIEVLCSMATKNLVLAGNASKMLKLLPHLQSVLQHVERQIEKTSKKELFGDEVLLYDALLSHLYDVTATVMSRKSPLQIEKKSGEYFKKALGSFVQKEWMQKLEHCDKETDLKKFSKEIVKKLKSKGEKNVPSKFVLEYTSRLFYCFDKKYLESAKGRESTKKKQKKQKDYSVIDALSKEHIPVEKVKILKKLQKDDYFLQDKRYCKIFYVERFASILHSWSRSIINTYSNDEEDQSKAFYRSSLSRIVASQCKLSCKVSLLCEQLARQTKIEMLLEEKPKDYLKEAEALCLENLKGDLNNRTTGERQNGCPKESKLFFENGLRIYDDAYSRLSKLKHFICVYSEICGEEETRSISVKVDDRCHELFDLALSTEGDFFVAPRCIVDCANYWMVRKKFEFSLKCFLKYFNLAASNNGGFKTECSAVCSYAKMLTKHSFPPPHNVEDAIAKCTAILNNGDKVIAEQLKKDIADVLADLMKHDNSSLQVSTTV